MVNRGKIGGEVFVQITFVLCVPLWLHGRRIHTALYVYNILFRSKLIIGVLCHMSSFQILTKDSVTVFVNAIMYYKVRCPTSAVANVDDYSGSARLLAATTLRNVLGTMNLGDILSQRESIAKEMQVKSNIYCLNAIVKCFFLQHCYFVFMRPS